VQRYNDFLILPNILPIFYGFLTIAALEKVTNLYNRKPYICYIAQNGLTFSLQMPSQRDGDTSLAGRKGRRAGGL
jgi:hypothetical protein